MKEQVIIHIGCTIVDYLIGIFLMWDICTVNFVSNELVFAEYLRIMPFIVIVHLGLYDLWSGR